MSASPGLPPGGDQDFHMDRSVTKCSTVEEEIQGDQGDEHFYCENCRSFYIDQCEIHGLPCFTPDSLTPMGVPQRALLTLPPGLVIGRSSMPRGGLGVFNQGQTVPTGMHFGPYDGEVTTREEAVESAYSWVICRGRDQYEYISAERDTHSNWMRYVVCAWGEAQQNLVAFQHRGRVLFRCCRPILPGQELTVWYAESYAKGLAGTWDLLWNRKWNPAGRGPDECSPGFPCPHCKLSFPAESYLSRHIRRSHPHEYQSFLESQPLEPESPSPILDMDPCLLASNAPPTAQDQPATCTLSGQGSCQSETPGRSLQLNPTDSQCPRGNGQGVARAMEAPDEEAHKCGECAKSFARACHLKRHQRSSHSKEKPYCCLQCMKCFSEAYGLRRHALTHRGESERGGEVEGEVSSEVFPCSECSFSFVAKLGLHRHLKRHHHGEYLRLVESGSVAADALLLASDPPYEPPASVTRSALTPLRTRSQKGSTGRPRGRPRKNPPNPKPKPAPRGRPKQVQPAGAEAEWPQRCAPCGESFGDAEMLRSHRCERQGGGGGVADDAAEPPPVAPAHTCGECQRTFPDLEALRRHECIQAGEGPHGCPLCGLFFNRSCNLRRHERAVHARERPYCCAQCGKSFTQRSGFTRHQESHARRRARRHSAALATAAVFPCAHCPFSFTAERFLHKHTKRHHPEEYVRLLAPSEEGVMAGGGAADGGPHHCAQCGKTFGSLKGFKAHRCFRRTEKLYLCNDCGKGFAWFNSLRQHQRTHTGEKPYRCPACGKSFSHSGQLNVHLRTHTGEKPFLCAQCGESFRQSGDLKRHERKHTGVRPCQCAECGKSFSRPQSLKAHQQLHSGKKLYSCSQCGKSFARRYHLTRHHQKMHC